MATDDSRKSLVAMLMNIQQHIRQTLYRGDFNYDSAIRTLYQHLDTAAEIQDHLLRARTYVLLATIEAERNAFEHAETLFLQASDAYDAAGMPVGVAVMYNNLGEVMRRLGKVETASEYYQKAAPIVAEFGKPGHVINLASNQGLLWVGAGQPEKALPFFEEAMARVDSFVTVPREVSDMFSETLNGIALAYLQLGDLRAATEYAERALEQALEVATIDQMASAYQTLAQITIASEASPNVIIELLDYSEQQWRRFHSNIQLGDFLLIKGDYFAAQGNTEAAGAAFAEALTCFEQIEVVDRMDRAQQRLHALRE